LTLTDIQLVHFTTVKETYYIAAYATLRVKKAELISNVYF